ncbi:MAG: hypothetical protein E7175_02680 [Erysipelotrichaceae bacterium]|nr:hypothetical protein [Erysipelotrichaceae bacterium]
MVGFKKDPSKKDRWENIKSDILLFFTGGVISVFLVLYIILFIANKMINNVTPITPTSSSEIIPTSSEVIASSIEESSSAKDYKVEKDIITHMKESIESYSGTSINDVTSIYSDTDYLCIDVIEDDTYFSTYKAELGDKDICEVLEALALSSDDTLITGLIDKYLISEVTPNVLELDVFKNDARFSGYTYKCSHQVYVNVDKNDIFLSAIGYKDDSYQIIASLVYNKPGSSIDESHTSIINPSSITSIYKDVIEYLYNK